MIAEQKRQLRWLRVRWIKDAWSHVWRVTRRFLPCRLRSLHVRKDRSSSIRYFVWCSRRPQSCTCRTRFENRLGTTHTVALEHNKHFETSIVELMFSCFNLECNTAIVLLKKLEHFVAEPVLNSDSTWEVKNHALETLVKYSAITKQFTPTSCFWTSLSR